MLAYSGENVYLLIVLLILVGNAPSYSSTISRLYKDDHKSLNDGRRGVHRIKLERDPTSRARFLDNLMKLRKSTNTSDLLNAAPVPLINWDDWEYYTTVGIGKPVQTFRIMVDTSSSNLWVPSVRCKSRACKIHKLYDSTKSLTYHQDGRPIDLNYLDSLDVLSGILSVDTVTITDQLVIINQTFAESTVEYGDSFIYDIWDGILGLAFRSLSPVDVATPLENMISQGLLEKPIFSFYINWAQGQLPGGELMLGGVDKKYYEGQINYVPIVENTGYWKIKMSSINVDGTSERDLCSGGCEAILDTGNPFIVGPLDEVVKINKRIGAYEQAEGIYSIPGCKTGKLPDVELEINGIQYTITPNQYSIIVAENACLSAFRGIKNYNFWILGDSFISSYYTVFDYDQKQIGFAKAKNYELKKRNLK